MRDSFNTKLDHWQKLLNKKENGQANDYYWSEMFDEIVEIVEKKSHQFQGKFRFLISLVGYSPEPLIITIKALRPERVYFIVTNETENQLDIIQEKCDIKPSQFRREIVDSSNTADVYEAIKKFIKDKDIKDIAIDITGGKKSMVGGAAEAAGFLGCSVFYVDYEKYLPELRKPKPGSEFLNFLDNPYQIFGDLEIQEALVLYERGNYPAALQIIGRLITKVPNVNSLEIMREIILLQQNWEFYQFEKALYCANKSLDKIKRYRVYFELENQLNDKISILELLINDERTEWLVLNHFFAAKKWALRKQFDFAIMLLYRTLEMAFSVRLKNEYSLNSSNPDYSKYTKLLSDYNQVIKGIYGDSANEAQNLPEKIGFMSGAGILSALSDDIVENVNLKQLLMQSDNRNKGILAHGTTPNTENQYNSMENSFLKILNRFCIMYLDVNKIDDLQQKFEPIKLNI